MYNIKSINLYWLYMDMGTQYHVIQYTDLYVLELVYDYMMLECERGATVNKK